MVDAYHLIQIKIYVLGSKTELRQSIPVRSGDFQTGFVPVDVGRLIRQTGFTTFSVCRHPENP